MFYSQLILAKKGPLGKIWLAAHFEKKLTKQQIFSTDIVNTVDTLLNPTEPLSLRVSGHLMLGLVRIYSKKVKYLMIDCTDTVWKIQLAFKPGKVDIDPQQNLNVDDNRFYGNISMEMDYPVLENVAFAPNFLPVRKANNNNNVDNAMIPASTSKRQPTADELNMMQSPDAIEFVRAADDRASLLSSRASYAMPGAMDFSQSSANGRKTSLLGATKFEDILPAFEDKAGDHSLFAELGAFEPLQFPAAETEMIVDPLSQQPQPVVEAAPAKATTRGPKKLVAALPEEEEAESEVDQAELEASRERQERRKRRVQLNEKIELSDEAIRQVTPAPLTLTLCTSFLANPALLSSLLLFFSSVEIHQCRRNRAAQGDGPAALPDGQVAAVVRVEPAGAGALPGGPRLPAAR
jgi:cohesin complex subunit SCC1